MPKHVIVVERRSDFRTTDDDCIVVTAREYITGSAARLPRHRRVVNLCHDYRCLSLGYYCSLLAEARGTPVIPAVNVLLDLGWKRLYSKALPELNELLRRAAAHFEITEERISVRAYFGETADSRFTDLARRVFDFFGSPILEVAIQRRRRLEIRSIASLSIRRLEPGERGAFQQAFARHRRRRWGRRKIRPALKHRLAVLHDPAEAFPPSDPGALRKLIRIGAELGVHVELITRKDYGRMVAFDALFIRETTGLDHHTYHFAKKAESLGLPVIDDPTSILRCANKVYLAEVFQRHRIPTPRTMIVDRQGLDALEHAITFPIIMKIPDGSFSRGVFKAKTHNDVHQYAERILKESDVILAQEYMYTPYDWRIGIINNQLLFACQYIMPGRHWQILRHNRDGRVKEGSFKAFEFSQVPSEVLDCALRATKPIGNGFYGVDLKQTPQGVFVIEVNDNPNIYSRFEDRVPKDELYKTIINEFIRRIETPS